MRNSSEEGPSPQPGEVSLAHNGVLFLDELPELKKHALEVLRQPIEDGEVTIAGTNRTPTFPARFTLITAMSPCPCGCILKMARIIADMATSEATQQAHVAEAAPFCRTSHQS